MTNEEALAELDVAFTLAKEKLLVVANGSGLHEARAIAAILYLAVVIGQVIMTTEETPDLTSTGSTPP